MKDGAQVIFTLVFCPILIVNIALHETLSPKLYQKAGWLGELSYSSYLLHFPMQLICAIAVSAGLIPAMLPFTTVFLVGFYAVLILLSLLSYHHIERPTQQFVLRRLSVQGRRVLSTIGKRR